MSPPHYDLALDEISVALSYVTMSIGDEASKSSSAPTKKDSAKNEAPKKKETPKETPEKETAKDLPPQEEAPKKNEEDDDFDVFGDEEDAEMEIPKESRKDMLARLKKEAEERTAKKEAKQRTLVSIEVKPWDTEQDLMTLWKKITTTIVQDGVKFGEACHLADVAFGIKKICMTFVMGVNNSSDDIVEAIQGMEDEVQSVEVMSMNVL